MLPLLAVIIPVYATTAQDVALLQRALRHLARQEGRPPTHVVLVDDASPHSLNVSYAGGGQVLPLCPLPLGSLHIDWAPESTAALAAGGLAQSQPSLQGPLLAKPVRQHVMQCARVGAEGAFHQLREEWKQPPVAADSHAVNDSLMRLMHEMVMQRSHALSLDLQLLLRGCECGRSPAGQPARHATYS